jgi:hypothetical protein
VVDAHPCPVNVEHDDRQLRVSCGSR